MRIRTWNSNAEELVLRTELLAIYAIGSVVREKRVSSERDPPEGNARKTEDTAYLPSERSNRK